MSPSKQKKKALYVLEVGNVLKSVEIPGNTLYVKQHKNGRIIWEVEVGREGELRVRLCNPDTTRGFNHPSMSIHPIVGNSLILRQQSQSLD